MAREVCYSKKGERMYVLCEKCFGDDDSVDCGDCDVPDEHDEDDLDYHRW